MPAPPNDITPSELFLKLSSTKRTYEIVDFPRKDPATGEPIGQVAMFPLTQDELIIAQAEATRHARAIIKEKFDATERIEGYAQVYENASAVEILFRTCKRPENINLPSFPRSSDVRKLLTADEVAVMIQSYVLVQNRLGPIVTILSNDEYEAWITRLQMAESDLPLSYLSSDQRNSLLMYLAVRHVRSPMDSTSAGQPLEDSTSNEVASNEES